MQCPPGEGLNHPASELWHFLSSPIPRSPAPPKCLLVAPWGFCRRNKSDSEGSSFSFVAKSGKETEGKQHSKRTWSCAASLSARPGLATFQVCELGQMTLTSFFFFCLSFFIYKMIVVRVLTQRVAGRITCEILKTIPWIQ